MVQYTIRLDVVSSTVLYLGKAAIGSSESGLVWQITKLDQTSGIKVLFPVGSGGSFNYSWTDRASYTYA